MTRFYYDAEGNRILTVLPNSTKIYTPFPEYEESITSGGAATQRSSFYLAGQLMAVRVVSGVNSNYYFAFADHLGSVSAWTDANGALTPGSLARYEPYGGYRTLPTGSNPVISDRGFTGHKHNNTGSPDLGLIYMNARYYLPEIGRFISADSLIPDPANPQSYNRYSYVLNTPTNLTDPSGHRPSSGCDDYEGCSLSVTQRRDFISSYASLLLDYTAITGASLTDVDMFAQVMDYAAEFNTTTKEWANDLTSAINRTTGAFTLITALGKNENLKFNDEGFDIVYQDDQNQVYHWWAYVNTTAQAGKAGIILGKIGNVVHEFYDPTGISHKSGRTGNSWEDYALAENGLAFGLALYEGSITPDTASDAMRDALNVDSRSPALQWVINRIPNEWLGPNMLNKIYQGVRSVFD